MPGPLPDQTPINILKAGAADILMSPTCQKALAEIGLEPGDFGTYSQVKRKIDKAKAKVADHAKGGPEPDEREKYLARCWSGHLMQDAVAREQGARGNPCRNVIDGFNTNQAPACPMEGDPADPTTEHGQVTLMEQQQAGAAGPPNTVCYNEGQRQADEDARVDQYVKMRRQRMKDARKDTEQEGQGQSLEGVNKGYSDSDAAKAAGSKGTDAAAVAAPGAAGDPAVETDPAAECIKNWRRKAEQEMKDKCKQDYQNNPSSANPSSPPSAVDAKTKALEADRAKKWEDYHAEAAKDPADEAEQKRKYNEAMDASKARNNYCRGLQGKALAEGRGRTTGRVPSNALPPAQPAPITPMPETAD